MASARKNHRRRRGRSRLGFLFKLLCIGGVVVALTMGATVFFRVESVVVTGNSRYTQEEVVAATGIELGDNLFHMNKYEIYDQVRQSLPYIEDVNIRRSLPNTILLTVSEWSAAAQILPASGGGTTSAGEGEDQEAGGEQQEQSAAQEAWLISVGGKLLEPAPADSTAMEVSGLTALMPQAGTMLAVPQEEQFKLEALLGLLPALEERGMLSDVSSVELGDTQIQLRYLGRYNVKMPLNEDFSYNLGLLQTVVEDNTEKYGEQSSGTMDLTQEQYDVVFSPD